MYEFVCATGIEIDVCKTFIYLYVSTRSARLALSICSTLYKGILDLLADGTEVHIRISFSRIAIEFFCYSTLMRVIGDILSACNATIFTRLGFLDRL